MGVLFSLLVVSVLVGKGFPNFCSKNVGVMFLVVCENVVMRGLSNG